MAGNELSEAIAVLPQNWIEVRLRDICLPVSQGGPGPDRDVFRYIDLGAIDNTSKRIVDARSVSVAKAPSRAKQVIRRGDVVFSNVRVYLENIALVPAELNGGVASTAFSVLRPAAGIDPRYLYYFVTSRRFVSAVSALQRGNSPPSVQDGDVRAQTFPLAPPQEQRRIASRIDELFSRIDEGEEALERVQKLVERYRQSVLKAAVTGELTREWREKHRGKLESGEALLARILAARREAWETAELDRMKARGQKPANNDWRRKYREPSPPDTTDVPKLPNGWVWASVEQLSTDVTYGTSAKCNDDPSGIPVIRMGNIDAGELDVGYLKYLPEDHDEFPALLLSKGDLLFNRTNSAELVGKSAIFSIATGKWSFASYLIRVRFAIIPSEWIAYYINSVFGRSWIAEVKNQQVGQANVNGSKLKSLAVPVPPLAEMAAAIDLVTREIGKANSITNSNLEELRRAQALRQAVLSTAFKGCLVHQDPADEPASVLLERIAAERTTTTTATKRTRKAKQPA